MEDAARTRTIQGILASLENFKFSPSSAGSCTACSRDYEGIVEHIRKFTESYFDGLCLDCLDKSRPRTGDSDKDYWRHADLKEDAIVLGCRRIHRQPTWYFSFMGRKADRDIFLADLRSEREA